MKRNSTKTSCASKIASFKGVAVLLKLLLLLLLLLLLPLLVLMLLTSFSLADPLMPNQDGIVRDHQRFGNHRSVECVLYNAEDEHLVYPPDMIYKHHPNTPRESDCRYHILSLPSTPNWVQHRERVWYAMGSEGMRDSTSRTSCSSSMAESREENIFEKLFIQAIEIEV
ncbi:hypothetical protein FF38_01253 [Lucilia cuprina]|uniref:Uncharacterized protein n=1 Tax=Lucilia cuprina TaxID=7375 RepID=A0A0L0CJG4_LUCCU|nr:hypothetical protein FF38_01253 [Lucilia cuprina]